jgi:hypothetical protein
VRSKPAVLASLVVHGAALLLAARWMVMGARAPGVPSQPPVAAAGAEPIAIQFLEGGGAGGAEGGTRRASAAHGSAAPGSRGDARIAGTRAGAGELAGRGPGVGERPGAPGGRWMKMRGADLQLEGAFVAEFLRHDRSLEVTPRSGRVAPSGGGSYAIHDRVTDVSIDRDGTAHFHDKPDIDIHWDFHLPTVGEIKRGLRQRGRDIAAWYEDPYKQARVGPIQDVPSYLLATPGACNSWGDACSTELRQRERPDDADRPSGLAHGEFDLTAMLMRHRVADPYASRKLALLDSTRAERADIAARNAKEDLGRSALLMQRNLEWLWRTTSDPVARRQALFTLWDECSEGDGPAGEAGQRARLLVIGWIRARLPAGSPGAYAPDELAQLSAQRTSSQPFVPYE